MSLIACDIALIPDKGLSQSSVSASRDLANYGSLFTLSDSKYYPHLSLYMFQLDDSKIVEVTDILQKIARETNLFLTTAENFSQSSGVEPGYVCVDYETKPEMAELQSKVVNKINPLRSGMLENEKNKIKNARGLKLDNLNKYGYPAIGELFRPHITLTRLNEYKPKVLGLLPDITTFDGKFNKIGIFEMGQNGTCIREISVFNLQSTEAKS